MVISPWDQAVLLASKFHIQPSEVWDMPVWELRRFTERALAVVAEERRQSDRIRETSSSNTGRTIRYI